MVSGSCGGEGPFVKNAAPKREDIRAAKATATQDERRKRALSKIAEPYLKRIAAAHVNINAILASKKADLTKADKTAGKAVKLNLIAMEKELKAVVHGIPG